MHAYASVSSTAAYEAMEELLAQLKGGQLAPVYWFEGGEPFYLEQLMHGFQTAVVNIEHNKPQLSLLYGHEITLRELLARARQMPMQGRQCILVKEAQGMGDWEDKEVRSAFLRYIEHPSAFTILALAHHHTALTPSEESKKLSKGTFLEALRRHSVYFHARKGYDREFSGLIDRHVSHRGYQITQGATALLFEQLGNDLRRAAHALEAIFMHKAKETPIDEGAVRQYVGEWRDYTLFELQKAIASKDRAQAVRMTAYFLSNTRIGGGIVLVGALFSYFSKLLLLSSTPMGASREQLAKRLGVHPYFVPEYRRAYALYALRGVQGALRWLQWADRHLKGVKGGGLSEELIVRQLIERISY